MKILSIGIDIGTTTTHMVLSRLTLDSSPIASRLPENTISQKEIIYRSPVRFTPLTTDGKINADGVVQLLQEFYREADITPDMVQTGALIITGESARRRNAKEVAKRISGLAGDFVVESAGANLESALAARGSGAFSEARRSGKCLVNIDIGGGTSNVALIKNGRLLKTACLNIGGRCIQLKKEANGQEKTFQITATSNAGDKLLNNRNDFVSLYDLEKTADLMCDLLLHLLEPSKFTLPDQGAEIYSALLMTDNFCSSGDEDKKLEVDQYWFSGGVGHLMAAPEIGSEIPYGDIGQIFALRLKEKAKNLSAPYLVAPESITATVIGAGMHSLQISGSTIEAGEDLLPLKNMPLLKVHVKHNQSNWLAREVGEQREALNMKRACALVLEGIEKEEISFRLIKELAREITDWQESEQEREIAASNFGETPCVILSKQDVAMSLSQILKGMLRNKRIITVDGIDAGEGDYVDIGKPLHEGKDPNCTAIPVVIKTLLFNI